MLPKFDVATVWRYLLGTEQAKVNIFMGVPTMYVKLIEEYDKNINGGSITANYVKATCRQNIRWVFYYFCFIRYINLTVLCDIQGVS